MGNDGRIQKGEVRNPNGRPKGSISAVSALKRALKEYDLNDPQKRTKLQQLVDKTIEKAIVDGDVSIIKDIYDRLDGKPAQKTDVTTGGEKIMFMPPELMEKNEITRSTEQDSQE